MSSFIPGNNKHLSLKDREYIEQALNNRKSFREIARYLCKDPSTISKEVWKRRIVNSWNRGSFNNPYNFCIHRYHCKKTNACGKLVICDTLCRSCHKCNSVCPRFERESCRQIQKAPYVCNGCEKERHRCSIHTKYDYNAKAAQRQYEELLSDSRAGVNLTAKELYNYIDQNLLLTRNIDLKRKVKFKKRCTHNTQILNPEIFIGRTYKDFKETHADELDFWEMDTVLSAKGSLKCVLTLYFPPIELLWAHVMDRCSPGAVKAVFQHLQSALGDADEFAFLMPVILTDRGQEFRRPDQLESDPEGNPRTSIFYCDPMRSNQKAGIENVHTMLRMILPKGTVFTDLTQWDIRKCTDHINNAPRKNLEGKTPYEMAVKLIGPEILKKMQLRYVAPDQVTLSPKLLRN